MVLAHAKGSPVVYANSIYMYIQITIHVLVMIKSQCV